jgi:hypothetical protein
MCLRIGWLGKYLDPKDEATADCNKVHSEPTRSVYCTLNIARMIHSGRMRWAGHVARVKEISVAFGCMA